MCYVVMVTDPVDDVYHVVRSTNNKVYYVQQRRKVRVVKRTLRMLLCVRTSGPQKRLFGPNSSHD